MINKRLLIKNLLAHTHENSFYDKKRRLELETREGKSKFLKHICALSNANPNNNSYLAVGIEDADNTIVGVDFFDDSRIQNLVNAYLDNPPKILYENIPFPHLPKDKVVGLVTIYNNKAVSCFKKGIHTIYPGTVYRRIGSNSMPYFGKFTIESENTEIVQSIEKNSKNSIQDTLDGVVEFMGNGHLNMNPKYKVFKELFVLCWAGIKKKVKDDVYYSRVDIELISEQIKLFYSAQDEVSIFYNEDCFVITEYISVKINYKRDFFPLEKVSINFFENGNYNIEREVVFKTPNYNKKLLKALFNNCLVLLEKVKQNELLFEHETKEMENIPAIFMMCHLQGFEGALNALWEAKPILKLYPDPAAYQSFKGAIRTLRKLKYETNVV
jgi:hypothetical protein